MAKHFPSTLNGLSFLNLARAAMFPENALDNLSPIIFFLGVALVVILLVAVFIFLFRYESGKLFAAREAKAAEQRTKKDVKSASSGSTVWRLVDRSGDVIPIKEMPVTIGRDPENDIMLKDPTVSAVHARIFFDDYHSVVCVQDSHSLNGIYVNGQPTQMNILNDGDECTFGSVSLILRQSSQNNQPST